MRTRTALGGLRRRDEEHVYSPVDGLVGGLIGGILMGMVTMLLFVLLGKGFWLPMKLIATLLLGADAVATPGFAMMPVLVGMLIHMALSMMFGAAMTWLGRYLPGEVLVRAIVLSLVLWAVTDFLVLPLLDQTFDRGMPSWVFAVGHLMYGIGLGGYLLARGRRATAV
jgi:hypothetical protein